MKASPGKKPLSVHIPFTKASACGNDFLLVESQLVSGDLKSLSNACVIAILESAQMASNGCLRTKKPM